MAILNKGTTYAEGSSVTANNLNQHVDNAQFVAGAGNTTDDSTLEVHADGYLKVKDGGIKSSQLSSDAMPESYTLPTASNSVLGGVKVGTSLSIGGNGVLDLNASGVSTATIRDLAVTNAKIANGTIDSTKLAQTFASGTHGHDNASQSVSGFMSSSDKSKLDGIDTGATSGGGIEKILNGYYSVDTIHSFTVESGRNVLLTMGFTGGNGGLASTYGEFQYNMGTSSMQMGAVGTGDIWLNATINYQVYFSPTNQYFLAGTSNTTKLHFRCNQTNLVGHYGVPSGKNFWATAFYIS